MKKSLVALTLLAGMTGMNANATLISFDDSSFGGTGVQFDQIDWTPDSATVSQKDTGDGIISANPDLFSEFGQTMMVALTAGSNLVSGGVLPYQMFIDYTFGGTVSGTVVFGVGNALSVLFNTGKVDLFVDTNLAAGRQVASSTKLGTFSLTSGDCLVKQSSKKGSCDINLRFTATPGYFKAGGTDVAVYGPVNSYSNLTVTVQGITGLNNTYPGGSNSVQNFTISHDGNQTFTISEPATVAALGLGLLGLGFSRRNKKQA